MSPTTDSHESLPIRLYAFAYPAGIWVLMAVIAVLNGVFRELFVVPRIGEYLGHVFSTLLLVAAILVVSFLYFENTPIDYTRTELLLVGVVWTVLTVGFEFLIGYIEGTPTEVTVGQYDVFAGQVWVLVPLVLLTAPLLFGWYAR